MARGDEMRKSPLHILGGKDDVPWLPDTVIQIENVEAMRMVMEMDDHRQMQPPAIQPSSLIYMHQVRTGFFHSLPDQTPRLFHQFELAVPMRLKDANRESILPQIVCERTGPQADKLSLIPRVARALRHGMKDFFAPSDTANRRDIEDGQRTHGCRAGVFLQAWERAWKRPVNVARTLVTNCSSPLKMRFTICAAPGASGVPTRI